MAGNHTHVAVGLLVGVGVAAVLHLDPEATALFAMTSGGAALLPDLDDDTSAVTDAAGVVLALPLSIFRRIVIRHRGPTHALPICLALAVVVYWVGHLFGKAHGSIPAYWPIRLLMPVLLALLGTRSALRIGSGEHLRPLLNHRHRFYIEVLAGLCIGYIGYDGANGALRPGHGPGGGGGRRVARPDRRAVRKRRAAVLAVCSVFEQTRLIRPSQGRGDP